MLHLYTLRYTLVYIPYGTPWYTLVVYTLWYTLVVYTLWYTLVAYTPWYTLVYVSLLHHGRYTSPTCLPTTPPWVHPTYPPSTQYRQPSTPRGTGRAEKKPWALRGE